MSYLVSPTAFFQTNVGAAEILVSFRDRGCRWGGSRVLDLYCGSGLFLVAAGGGGRDGDRSRSEPQEAIANAESIVQAQSPAARPALVNHRARRGRAGVNRQGSPGTPSSSIRRPRDVPPAVIAAVFGQIRPSRVVYVWCVAPMRSRRTCPVILNSGYRVSRVQPVDMFPHTNHVETVIVFERGPTASMTPARLTPIGIIASTVAAALVECYTGDTDTSPPIFFISLAGFGLLLAAGARLRGVALPLFDGGNVLNTGDPAGASTTARTSVSTRSGCCRCWDWCCRGLACSSGRCRAAGSGR